MTAPLRVVVWIVILLIPVLKKNKLVKRPEIPAFFLYLTMQPDFLILKKFLGLYQKKISSADFSLATNDCWNKNALSRISFFLFQNNISNVLTSIEIDQLPTSSLAGIAAQTDDLGQDFYYHWENGQQYLLFSRNHTAEGTYQFNNIARFMVYDKEALTATSFNDTPAIFSGSLKPVLLVLFLLFAIVCADVLKGISLPMLLVQLSGLLNVVITGIILFKEHSIFNAFTERFCNSETYTGCNKLLHSKASMVFGKLSLATLGTVLYFALLLYSLLATTAESYLHWAIILAAGAMVVSLLLVIKMMVIRTYCRLCLWIHGINFLTFLSLYLFVPFPLTDVFSFNYNPALVWLISFITASLVLFVAIRFMDALQKNNASMDEIGGLKATLLESVLLKAKDENLQRANELYKPLSFPFSEECDLILTLVLSTHCRFCAELTATIARQNLATKISKLEVYLYVDTEDTAVSTFLENLEHAPSNEGTLTQLMEWYEEDRGHQNEAQARHTDEMPLPAFCLPKQALPYAELPAVFINGIFIPHVFGAADLEKLLYYFSLPG
jgi:hypothetical protein